MPQPSWRPACTAANVADQRGGFAQVRRRKPTTQLDAVHRQPARDQLRDFQSTPPIQMGTEQGERTDDRRTSDRATGETTVVNGDTMLIHQLFFLPDDAGATKSAIPLPHVAWVASAAGTSNAAERAGSPSTGHPGAGTATSTTSSAHGATMPCDSGCGAGWRG
jgi:hypothetical protein